MPVLTASEARANLYRLMDEAAESHEPISTSSIAFSKHAHRLVYEVFRHENTVRVLRMWTYYE